MTRRLSLLGFRARQFGWIAMCGLLLAAGCHRPPQTAAELAKALPATFSGEVQLQGETQPRPIRLEPRELSVRGEHVLEFNRVDYHLLDARGAVMTEGEARIRGTIAAPGLQIQLEVVGAEGGSEEAVRPETFSGKLSADLQALEAEWSTSLGQKAKLTAHGAAR